MDEEALRAMMPMSFGRASKAKGGSLSKGQEIPASSSASVVPSLGLKYDTPTAADLRQGASGQVRRSVGPAKRPAAPSDDDDDDDDQDDGLTAEERAANAELDRRRQEAADEDDDASDEDGSVDLGPEPGDGLGGDGQLPIAESVDLRDHSKTVSALAVDHAGARVATGGFDYDVKLWDFGGMTSAFRPFKSWEPAGTYWVHDLAWSASGDQLLVASGTPQPKLFDRDGNLLSTFNKGDIYIRDMKNTKGHVAEVTSCAWQPHNSAIFATASADSSLRLWSAEDPTKQQKVIVVRSKERGTRTKVTSMAFSHDGRTIAAGCFDGALHLWGTNTNAARPDKSVENAHQRNTETSSVVFSRDSHTLATRGGDDTVKLWDLRSFKRPIATRDNLPNDYGQTSVIFSLDERTLLTGTSVVRAQGAEELMRANEAGEAPRVVRDGAIEVMSRDDLAPIQRIGVGKGSSIVRLHWASKTNQLLASSSSGSVSVFYDPQLSSRGALLCVGKRAKTQRVVDSYAEMPIITPLAGDSVSRGQGTSQAAKKRRLEKMRQDSHLSKMPERPMAGPGKGGRIGAAATQHVVQSIWTGNTRTEDPRDALLKYADKGDDKERQWTGAWSKTQPKAIYADDEEDGDGQQRDNGATK